MLLLPSNLAVLAKLAAKYDTRLVLTGVRVQETTDGYQVMATDGRRLGIVTGCDKPPPEYIESHPLADAPNGADVALVPAKEWARIVKAESPGKVKNGSFHDMRTALVMAPNQCTFSRGADRFVVNTEDGRYPDAAHVVASIRSVFKIEVNAKLFAELLQVAAAFAADDGSKVTLHFHHSQKPFLVCSENTEQRFVGVMMPLTRDDPTPKVHVPEEVEEEDEEEDAPEEEDA